MLPSPSDSSTNTSPGTSSTESRWQPPSHPHGRPRQKRHHHKSRDGCVACRQRRIKCDEQKPACVACLKKGYDCDYGRTTPPAESAPSTSRVVARTRPPSALVPLHFSHPDLEFFIENGLYTLTLASGSMTSHDQPVAQYAAFSKFWRLLVLPVAYHEPHIMNMVLMFTKRHQTALTPAQIEEPADYVRMLRIMSEVVRSCTPDTIIIGAMIFFAYERLQSAATGEVPADQNHVHYDVVMKLLPRVSKSVMDRLMPVICVTWNLMRYWTKVDGNGHVDVPARFENPEDARHCFVQIFESSEVTPALDKWLKATLALYHRLIGNDWEGSKIVLTMLSEAQLFKTALDLSVAKKRQPGLLPS